ncbi:DNA polymerase-3 subunit delta' [Pontibacter aydingkolensis]|uniref:DNA polymerase III subunit delta n=1 Tax=Pontibacter aydingkolensis TaxID=1911536 RepID=A0ABS7CP80_9BACT|nr:DNA polymerase III subunit delta [Pontibacter aydingkolensis]MBW7465628.1 DNA polymerase III subunit delta [Pontibacter aydingkolensis]
MQFSQIIGHKEAKGLLLKSVQQNHVAHAQLFLGQEGSANLALALAYATYINCENKQPDDSCGTCSSCVKMNKLVHPDFNFVMPVTTTKSVSKDALSSRFMNEWREFILASPYQGLNDWMQHIGAENKQGNISKEESRQLVKLVSLKAFEGDYKIVVIWLPELMHPSASNALLKLLEEPPVKTLFLLVAQAAEKLLATITSRTQIMQVRSFTEQEVIQYLQEKYNTNPDVAYQVAQLAEGNLNVAAKLTTEITSDYFSFFTDWMRNCYSYKFAEMIDMSDKFQTLGRENQKNFLLYALNLFRKVMLYGIDASLITYLPPAELDFVQKFSKLITVANASQLTEELNQAHYHIERNANPKIVFVDSSIQIAGYLRGN